MIDNFILNELKNAISSLLENQTESMPIEGTQVGEIRRNSKGGMLTEKGSFEGFLANLLQ